MNLIAVDILAEARGLTMGVTGTGVAVGLALLLFGWKFHRVWTVAGVTVAGGIFGLTAGHADGRSALVLALLLSVSAGMLALEFARIFAFLAAGSTMWLIFHRLFPAWHDLWVVFLAGGLAGLLLYRFWTMILTSFIGTMLFFHAGLTMMGHLFEKNMAVWAGNHRTILSIGISVITLIGFLFQIFWHRWRARVRAYKLLQQIQTTEKLPPVVVSPPVEEKTSKMEKELKALRDALAKLEKKDE
ncbi:MAG: hypothetical protein R3B84_23915 [Zavarzinella sp.]